MLLDFRDVGQTGITILSQQLGNSVKTNLNGEVKKDLLGLRSAASSVINGFSTMTGSSYLICSDK
jgi:hypothetical protein